MGGYVELGDVRTWYDEHGEGEPLVLLHPGGADARAWAPNLDALAGHFHVFTPERRGHGRSADAAGPITYELMAQDTIAFLEEVVGGPAQLVGCSAGATVALLVALRRPDLARSLVLVSGVFHRDGWFAGAIDPDASPPEVLARGHAELSPDGPDHFPVVNAKLARMNWEEPTLAASELSGVTSRTLVMTGDDDEVTLEHAIAMYRGLPDAELAVVPGTSHGLLHEKPALCNAIIVDFLTTDPVPTFAPLRRAGHMVQANGVGLCVETFGDPADPPILLIHGAGNSMLSWADELCERLAAGPRFVIRYDSRDAGRSVAYEPGAPPYALRDLVADAVGLLDSFGLASAHLVGMSTGAAIAQLAALDHPDRVASLTLASSTPGIPGQEARDLPPTAKELDAFFEDEPAEPDWADRAAVTDYLVEVERPFAARSRPFDEAAMRDLAARVFDRSVNIASSLTNPFILDAGDPWRGRLGGVAAPTLVVHGTEDPLFPYGHGVALADEIPGAELLALEQTGHEYFPRGTWDLVVPAILRHTLGRHVH